MSQIKTHLPSTQFLCAGITAVLCLIAFFGTTIAQGMASDSLRVLEAAAKASRRDGNSWTRLGYAYLGVNEFEQAETAFRKAIQYAKSPQAHNGLGLVYMQRPQERRKAFLGFRRALGIDPTFIEAQMNIARLHMQLGEMNAENAFKRAIEMDAGHAPAYFELANWYAEHEYEDRIADVFRQYLALRPDDSVGKRSWSRTGSTPSRKKSLSPALRGMPPASSPTPTHLWVRASPIACRTGPRSARKTAIPSRSALHPRNQPPPHRRLRRQRRPLSLHRRRKSWPPSPVHRRSITARRPAHRRSGHHYHLIRHLCCQFICCPETSASLRQYLRASFVALMGDDTRIFLDGRSIGGAPAFWRIALDFLCRPCIFRCFFAGIQ